MWPWQERPKPVVIVYNVLHEEIDRIEGARDLVGLDLRGKQWSHVDLSGLWLDGADITGANMFGARCVGTSFARCNLRNAELSFSNAYGANFQKADLDGCLMYRTETTHARFDDALLSERSDIPGRKVFRTMRVIS